jgi:hypothetical protein
MLVGNWGKKNGAACLVWFWDVVCHNERNLCDCDYCYCTTTAAATTTTTTGVGGARDARPAGRQTGKVHFISLLVVMDNRGVYKLCGFRRDIIFVKYS